MFLCFLDEILVISFYVAHSLSTRLKTGILGKSYALSLVFVSDEKSRVLNEKHRGKNEPANILSFPLSEEEGEIYIAPRKAAKDAPIWKMSYRRFVLYLFIHGLLHLKGLPHGSRMEKEEQRFLKKYTI
ncbi:MAG: rRNA maturation RNase YbeY [Parcubacteria group bacterium]|nr:rRNA maturation RNase YbeY [Parcubacteria group bacterium]